MSEPKKIRALSVAGGELHETFEFASLEELEAFRRGMKYGELCFGGAGPELYSEDDLPRLEASSFQSERRAAGLIRTHLCLPGDDDDSC